MSTVADNLQKLVDAKSNIRTAIQNKGVAVPDSASISTYNTYINSIQTGTTGKYQAKEYHLTENGRTEIVVSEGYDGITGGSITVHYDASAEKAEAYNSGLTEGYYSGKTAGYASGTTVGYNSGYTAGYSSGKTDGYTSGKTAGYTSGYTAGYSSGKTEGYNSGYTAGYASGTTVGYNSGYTAGYTAGYNEGIEWITNYTIKIKSNVSGTATITVYREDGTLDKTYTLDYSASDWSFKQILCGYIYHVKYSDVGGYKTPDEVSGVSMAFGEVLLQPEYEQSSSSSAITYTTTDGNIITPKETGSTYWGANMVSNTYNDGVGIMTFDGNVTTVGMAALSACTNLQSINLPSTLTEIEDSAFSFCTSLTGITIPDGVTEIWELAFKYCTSLTYVSIPNSVTKISQYAFTNCYALPEITLPDSVTSIGGNTFSACTSLTSVTLSTGLTKLGWQNFANCSALPEITIPENITTISYGVFSGCTSLTEITFKGTTAPTFKYDNTFDNVPDTGTMYYPSGSDYSAVIAKLPSGWTSVPV